MKRLRLAVLILSPLFAMGLAFAVYTGLRVNHTESFPRGVYQGISKAPERGDLVLVDPPDAPPFRMALERGYLSPGILRPFEPMLKRLVAVGGDAVTIDLAGVTVNGRRLENSKPLSVDLAGRPLPVLRLHDHRLSDGEALLMSDYSPISFDGRYFGPIARARIQTVVRPVWTWRSTAPYLAGHDGWQ
jgi:conjugative transfer signal peptidase TraF